LTGKNYSGISYNDANFIYNEKKKEVQESCTRRGEREGSRINLTYLKGERKNIKHRHARN
jgi:hypothetical protein